MTSVTRGHGLLEGFLARKRAAMANTLLRSVNPRLRILDIGCGSTPFFLAQCDVDERVGMDQTVTDAVRDEWAAKGIRLVKQDLDVRVPLPFEDGYFDVVTLLAVFEHIAAEKLPTIIREIRRVLRPGGAFVMTTPASWTDPILWTMSRLHLVSHQEIGEHEETHTHESIRKILMAGGFDETNIFQGSFELGMNLWAKAIK